MLSSTSIAEKFVLQATNSGVIKDKDHDLYLYAFHALISYTCGFATMFVIALLMHRLIESVIFIFFFYPLRIYAGGFHEKTELRCYIISTIMFVGMILIDIVGVPGIPIWASCILLVLSVTAVFLKAPVESEKKPLSIDTTHIEANTVKKVPERIMKHLARLPSQSRMLRQLQRQGS